MIIEQIVFAYLKTKLDVDVYMVINPNHPESFVAMQKTDSKITNHVNAITLEFFCYAPTKYEAALLDEELKKAMLGDDSENEYGIVALDTVSSCKYGGGNDAPDTATKGYRYRSYYNLFY